MWISTSSSSFSEGEVAVLFWATIGGIMVFIGLLLEKFADCLNDRFLGGTYKPHKPLELVGWCILMAGIGLEIAVAGWFANDAWETRQIANKNNPLSQLVSDISASATINVEGTNFDGLPTPGIHPDTWLELDEKDINKRTLILGELRWTPSFRPLRAENKMGFRGLLSSLLLFVGCSLCALNPFGKERTSRAWHCSSSLPLFFGFQYLPPQAV